LLNSAVSRGRDNKYDKQEVLMRGILIICGLLVLSPGFVFAKTNKVVSSQQDLTRGAEKIMREAQASQERKMQELKKTDPKLYKEKMQQIDNGKEISEILASFRQGKISEEKAERALYPLVQDNMKSSLDGIDSRIATLKKKLKDLQKIKDDPSILVKKRVNQLLGREPVSYDDPLLSPY
jgi:hypothetical protein